MKHDSVPPQTRSLELIWLLGQPHLGDYLDFVAKKCVDGDAIDPRALVSEWRAANDFYYELEQREAGIADTIECAPIEAALEPLAEAIRANPWYRHSFDNLPAHFAKVELDKLVISQNHVERGFTDALGAAIGEAPDAENIFNFCLPLERPMPPVRIQRLSGDRFLFSCASTDFRAHDPRLLRLEELSGLESSGPVAAMVGLMIGFGSNFLSGIRSGSRVLLQNGYHRAFALRSLGFTHAYCILEDVTRKDELKLTADGDVAADPEYYFASKRPPILRDFFDERLTRVLALLPSEAQIEVEIKVRSSTATDC